MGGSLGGNEVSSPHPVPLDLDKLYLWDPFLAPGSLTLSSLRQNNNNTNPLTTSRTTATDTTTTTTVGMKSRKNSTATPGSSQKRKASSTLSPSRRGSYHTMKSPSSRRGSYHYSSDPDAIARAIKEAEDLAQQALAAITAAQSGKESDPGGTKGGDRSSRASMSRTTMRSSFANKVAVRNDMRQVELLNRRLIIFSKDGEDLSDHQPSSWATGENWSKEEDDNNMSNSNTNVGDGGGSDDEGGQGMLNSRQHLIMKLTKEASIRSLDVESIFAKALEEGDDPDDDDAGGRGGGGGSHLDTSQRAKQNRKLDPTNQFLWLQIVYFPDDCESVTLRLVPADLSLAFSSATTSTTTTAAALIDEPLDEYGMPIVEASPPVMFLERVLKIEEAKW